MRDLDKIKLNLAVSSPILLFLHKMNICIMHCNFKKLLYIVTSFNSHMYKRYCYTLCHSRNVHSTISLTVTPPYLHNLNEFGIYSSQKFLHNHTPQIVMTLAIFFLPFPNLWA